MNAGSKKKTIVMQIYVVSIISGFIKYYQALDIKGRCYSKLKTISDDQPISNSNCEQSAFISFQIFPSLVY